MLRLSIICFLVIYVCRYFVWERKDPLYSQVNLSNKVLIASQVAKPIFAILCVFLPNYYHLEIKNSLILYLSNNDTYNIFKIMSMSIVYVCKDTEY